MNLGDYDGRTALHLAAAEGHLRCVKFLLEECKVKYDCRDRWGQTPLTEAILFKHTKVASLIKRHERTKQMASGKSATFFNKAFQNGAGGGGGGGGGGEVLWRKLVERNFMAKPENPKPVYKFDKNHLVEVNRQQEAEQRAKEEKELEELKMSLKDKLEKKRMPSESHSSTSESLTVVNEERKKSIEAEMGLDGSQQEDDAARLIQNKFRDLKFRRLSKQSTIEENSKKIHIFVGGN